MAYRTSLLRQATRLVPELRPLVLPRLSVAPRARLAVPVRFNSSSIPAIEAPKPGQTSSNQKIQVEPRLAMTFTCTVPDCGHRSTHEFAKRSYEKGIVLVQCPGCKNRHLIADHLGWFKESTEDGKMRTVEDLLLAKGEKIRKGRVGFDGDIEYDGEA